MDQYKLEYTNEQLVEKTCNYLRIQKKTKSIKKNVKTFTHSQLAEDNWVIIEMDVMKVQSEFLMEIASLTKYDKSSKHLLTTNIIVLYAQLSTNSFQLLNLTKLQLFLSS